MNAKEYRTCDKSHWGDGPWVSEPDKMQWTDAATGLPCLIVRNTRGAGALCGYVGVAQGHPDFGRSYNEVDSDIDVHGGLTFSEFCRPGADESLGICHVPGPGEPEHVWWFGFDCSHCFDVAPAIDARLRQYGCPELSVGYPSAGSQYPATYKPIAYVQAEVRKLAQQLHARNTRQPEAA